MRSIFSLFVCAALLSSHAANYPAPAEGQYVIRDFRFRSGETLPELRMNYLTLGQPARDHKGMVRNAVLILHGTTGSSAQFQRPEFANELYGNGQPLDATKYFVIIPDNVGHGKSSKPSDGLRAKFPRYGYLDMIGAQHRLLTEGLGVDRLRLVIGTSMGGMHTWLWGQVYPEFMDALMPLASLPTQISGRNRVWRRLIIDSIRDAPDWNNGNYETQPHGLRIATEMSFFMGNNPVQRQKDAPTLAAADEALDRYIAERLPPLDANDYLYAFEASHDYDPEPGLEKITAPLLAINFADDLINPPELRILEREIKRVRRGKAIVLPFSDETVGHGGHTKAMLWKRNLAEFLEQTEPSGRTRASSSVIRFAGQDSELVICEVSERTVRIQLSPLSEDKPSPSTVLVPFDCNEKVRIRAIDRQKEIRAGKLRLVIEPQPLAITVRRPDGALVQKLIFDDYAATNAGVSFKTDAPVFGLGEGAQQFDRRGAFYPMEASWGGWNRPVLGSVVPSPFVIGTDGWAIFAHRPDGQFDLRDGKGRFIPKSFSSTNSTSSALDLFVIAVNEPADALMEYVRLTGRPAMPPKWAMGYFQSHRTLAGPEEPVQVARTFREKELPCDALIYLGTGYCTNGWNTGHGSVMFNTNAFVPENIAKLHDLNFKVVLHVNRAPRNLYGSFEGPSDPSDRSDEQPQGRSRQHIRQYWSRHRETFALGVDGWWPDDGDELPLTARLTRHLCYYDGPLQDRPNVRPWSLHRTGYAGAQRYGGWIWSGDTDGRWETLAAHVSVGLNHGLSLTPFWGSDTGGFYPTRELTGELYVRWFQFSAFCPSFRSHGRTWHLRLPWGWNTGEYGPIENNQNVDPAELHNPEVEPICKRYLELRYRLLPYNYTVAREAVDAGLPMMRALWLHYPNDAEAVKLGSEYLWGRDLLVAPVVEKGAKLRRVYLPAGAWYDWWTGEKFGGKRSIERPVDLATMPLYARAGAIVPLDPIRQYTSQPVNEPTVIRIFAGADGTFTLYDDDGRSLGYRDNSDSKTTWIRFRWNDTTRRLVIESDERMKRWQGGERAFAVEVIGRDEQPRRVEFSGKRVIVKL